MKMKTRYICGLVVAGLLSACGNDDPLDKEQYFKTVYITKVTTTDMLYKVKVPYDSGEVETFFSVGCGGSQVQDEDVTVSVRMADGAVDEYNTVQFPTQPEKHVIALESDRFRIPSMETVLQKDGESYARIPVFIRNEGLDPDRTYVIPLTIDTVSVPSYVIQHDISTILLGFTFTNSYEGNCSMEGTSTTDDVQKSIFGNKNLKAVDQYSVRIFAESYTESTELDQIETQCIKLTFNDTQITVSGWKQMEASGTGTYDPDNGKIHIEYEFTHTDGTRRQVTEDLTYNDEIS